MKRLRYRPLALAAVILLLFAVFRCHNYVWQDDFTKSIEGGLNEVFISGFQVLVRSNAYDFCIPGEDHQVRLSVHNPLNYALSYSAHAADPSLISALSIISIDSQTALLSFSVPESSLGKTPAFTVSVSSPSESRSFPDYAFSLTCHFPSGTGIDAVITLPDVSSGTLVFVPSSVSVLHTDAAFSIGASSSLGLPGGAVWAWYVDGVEQAGCTLSSFSFDASAASVGAHTLSATVDTGTARYSGSMLITVVSSIPAPIHSVSYDTAGGNASIPITLYAQGATVTAAAGAGARAGWTFIDWKTTDVDSGGAVTTHPGGSTFAMPDKNVLLTAVWTLDPLPVTGLSCTAGASEVGLWWTDPVSTELISISVEWFPTVAGSPVVTRTLAPGAGGTLISGLVNGTSYTFRATAMYTGNVLSTVAEITATPAVP
jgi:hypothetical protein